MIEVRRHLGRHIICRNPDTSYEFEKKNDFIPSVVRFIFLFLTYDTVVLTHTPNLYSHARSYIYTYLWMLVMGKPVEEWEIFVCVNVYTHFSLFFIFPPIFDFISFIKIQWKFVILVNRKCFFLVRGERKKNVCCGCLDRRLQSATVWCDIHILFYHHVVNKSAELITQKITKNFKWDKICAKKK